MRNRILILLMLVAAPSYAQFPAELPTELQDCVDDADGPSFCTSDSTSILMEEGCDATFVRYHAKIAWPTLRNVGPITISVKTRDILFRPPQQVPLYIEVARDAEREARRCLTTSDGLVILTAQGGPHCGGTWESVGPIDLAWFGIPLGTPYIVQAVFLESLPGTVPFNSIGFSCISITSHPTAVARATWSNIKVLYRR